jgi:hypothetical protein
MEKPEFANDVVGSYRAGLAASLRRLVAPPTVDAACKHLPDSDFAQKYGGFV